MLEDVSNGNKLLLAPMADISDYPFRKICKARGAGLIFTEMVSAEGVVKNQFETLRNLAFQNSERPIGVQILGSDPKIIGQAVKEISKLKPAVIDINCGCPVQKVTKHFMGSCLAENSEKLSRIISEMVDNSNGIPISVKYRLGKDKDNINIIQNSLMTEERGASFITIHARTAADKYDIEADWSWIKKVKEAVNIPVIGNGSIFSAQDAVDMMDATGCNNVMIARGSIGNPFIFSDYLSMRGNKNKSIPPSFNEVTNTLLDHIELLNKEYSLSIFLDKAKKNIIWYYKNFNGINYIIQNVFRISGYEGIVKFIEDHRTKYLNGNYPEEDLSSIDKKFKKRIVFWLLNDEFIN